MLFDLRGRGRRRTVKVIYVALALLFGVGFVGFGVGVGGGGGGLIDAFTNNEGSSGASFKADIKKDRKLVAAQPNNPAPLAKLIQDILRQAGTGENYVSNTAEGGFTPKAKGLLLEARQNWQRYLALNPAKPSSDLASQMLQVFSGAGGLSDPTAAVGAMQIVIAGRPPSAALYSNLAQLSYLAKDVRQGDLAASKAVSLAPAAQRGLLKVRLEQIKKNPSGEETSTAGAPVPVAKAKSGGKSSKSGKGATSTGATTTTTTTTSSSTTTTSAPLGGF